MNREVEVQDAVARHYDETRYALPGSDWYHRRTTRRLLGLAPLDAPVLDLGCGVGRLADHVPPSDVVGVDVSAGMVRRAAVRLPRLARGDAQRLPFRRASFGSVVCRGVLHHLPEPRAAVREVARVLRPGGHALFFEPVETLVSRLPRRLVADSGHFSEVHRDFARRELLDLVGSDLEVVAARPFGHLAYPLVGFPDVARWTRPVARRRAAARLLDGVDEVVSRIPGLRRLAWAWLVAARRRP